MKTLTQYIIEQLSDVKTKWHPKEGLFAGDDPQEIADYLLKNSKDEAQAMQRLCFYMNRAGDKLTNKTVLNKVKQILKSKKVEEKLIINKNFKATDDDLDKLIENGIKNLFKNISLDSDTIDIASIYFDIKYSSVFEPMRETMEFVKDFLMEKKLYKKEVKTIYLAHGPRVDFNKIKCIEEIANYMLEEYDKEHAGWNIYFKSTDKYFIMRLFCYNKNITADFVIEL